MRNIEQPPLMLTVASTLIGQAPWQVRLGYGSGVQMDFGDVLDEPQEHRYPRGSFQLWLNGVEWRIETGPDIAAGSGSDGSAMHTALQVLVGVKVVSIAATGAQADLAIGFSNEVVLRTFRTGIDDDAWRFYAPSIAIWQDRGGELMSQQR